MLTLNNLGVKFNDSRKFRSLGALTANNKLRCVNSKYSRN